MKRMLLFLPLAAALAVPSAGAIAQSSSATAAPTVVHIKNFAYAPAAVTVTTGTVIRFVNDDPVAHTVTATGANAFDSGNMDQNGAWTHTFDKAGTYQYLCTYHTYMKAQVVVKDAS
jgi:plastocyanin